MNLSRILRLAVTTATVVGFTTLAAHAATDRSAKCRKAKLRASAGYASCIANVDGRFLLDGDAAERSADLAHCASRMARDWSRKTEQFGAADCASIWDDADARNWLGACNDTLVTAIASSIDLRPGLDCIERNHDGSTTAHFGYENLQPGAVTVPVGANNGFSSAALDAGQVTTFDPGSVARAFAVRFRGRATWTLGGRSVTADRHSTPCPVQPPTPTACETELRTTFLAMEAAADLAAAQLRSSYATALALAEAGLAPAAPVPVTGTASGRSVPRDVAGACGPLIDGRAASVGQALSIAMANATYRQNQLIALLQTIVADVSASATAGTGNPSMRGVPLDAIVPGTTISAEALGNFEEWSAGLLADFLDQAAQAHVAFAAGALKIAASRGTIVDGPAPGTATAPVAPDPASPRSIVSDDIDGSSLLLATGGTQAIVIADQNLVFAHQQLDAVLTTALAEAASAVIGGKALFRGTLDDATDPDRDLSLDPVIDDLELPAAAAVDPAVAASAEAFFQLAQANHRGFGSAMQLLGVAHSSYASRILALVQATASPPASRSRQAAARAVRVVDPDAAPADVTLANLIAALAQNTNLAMQNDVVAQSGQFSTSTATLTQQIDDWLALP